jgi:hypothetical protein
MCILNSTNTIGIFNYFHINLFIDAKFKGLTNKKELTLMPELFLSEPNVKKWKIDFNLFTTSFYGGTGFGKSSIIVSLNEIPILGTCTVNPLSGLAETTIFTIKCYNFTDPDGFISKFEYYCKT